MIELPTLWIPISKAAKILNRTLNGVRYFIKTDQLRYRKVQKGNRLVYELYEPEVTRLAPMLPTRRRDHYSRRPRTCKVKGYTMIYDPQHPKAMCDGHIYEHWLVAEEILGRPLRKEECVYHLNGIKTDNRPENLKIFGNRSEPRKIANKIFKEMMKSMWPGINLYNIDE